jgi:4-amino-4-deoxy-L-arabinose transferase-like glycosyltransferase
MLALQAPPKTTPSQAPGYTTAPELERPDTGSIIGWIPFFWQRVLFPGRPAADERSATRAVLSLLGLSAILLYPFLNFYLFEPDEGRYAQIPREMLARGDWLVPMLQGEPYLDKPPLFYWLVMLTYQVFGPVAWAARLVPALAVQATVIVSYLLGRRQIGERAAYWGSLLMCLVPGLVTMGRLLVLDGLLTLWVTLGLLAVFQATAGPTFSRRSWLVASIALGLGVLTKGPVAVVLVLVPLVVHRWLMRPAPRIAWRNWALFAFVIAAISLPWYVAMSIAEPEFASYFLWKHNFQRFLQPFDHERPVWFFGPVLLIGMAPATLLLPSLVRYLLADRPGVETRRSPVMGYYLLASLICVFFFSLSGSKLPTYILPAFPPLCLALGAFLTHSGWADHRWLRPGLVVWACVMLVGHGWLMSAYAWDKSPMNHDATSRLYLENRELPIFCFPRHVDSMAFYLDRSDFQVYRSKELDKMFQAMDHHKRSIVLFGHRSSKLILTHNLPPHFRVLHVGPLGFCEIAVIERKI